jgi:hypothetical protein
VGSFGEAGGMLTLLILRISARDIHVKILLNYRFSFD